MPRGCIARAGRDDVLSVCATRNYLINILTLELENFRLSPSGL